MDSERDRSRDANARAAAGAFLAGLKTKNDEKRVKTAKELFKFVAGELKDEAPEYMQEFISFLDTKSDQSAVHECIYSPDLDEKKAGIFLIVCLAETSIDGESNRVVRFANFLLKVLTMPNMDEAGMELATRALAFLIQTSKSYAAELVEKCLDQCLEWLEPQIRIASINALHAALTITSQREAKLKTEWYTKCYAEALNTMKINELSKDDRTHSMLLTSKSYAAELVEKCLDQCLEWLEPQIRIASINALHAALTITSQREAKLKTEWYTKCYAEALNTMKINELSKDDRTHSMLLVLNELVRIADATFERTRLEALDIHQTETSIATPIEWLTQPRVTNTVESSTARALVAANFSEICGHAKAAAFSCGRSVPVHQTLLELFPRLSAWDQCEPSLCKEGVHDENFRVQKNGNALVALGLLMLQNPERYRSSIGQMMMVVTEMLNTAVSKKRTPEPAVFIFLTLFVKAYKTTVMNEIKQLLGLLFKTGLTKGLTSVMHEVVRHIPTLQMDVQDGLMKELYMILTGCVLPSKLDPPKKPVLPAQTLQLCFQLDCARRCYSLVQGCQQFPIGLEQHSARLLTQLARQSPKFMRPYLGPLLQALLPKLRNEMKHVDVTVHVLHAISELCVVGGAEIVRNIDPLFQKLTQLINDSSSLQRREAALRTIGRIARSTAYVVDPYKDYPNLLDDLLRLLKTEMSSKMRRQAISTLGILGALDPYTHKVFTGAVQSATSISTALSLPMARDAADPRQDIIQWYNYEKCTLEEFYPAITIANLMVMVQDEAFTQYYKEIAQALLTIFRSLGDSFPQYVQQVVPRLIEVTRACRGRPSHREFFLRQLASLVAIIKVHAKPYMKQIFSLIADAWSEDQSVKVTVVSVLEQIGTALGQEFAPHIAELIPYLLYVVQTDKSEDRKLTAQVLSCVRSLSGCLTPHLHLVLPPVLTILDDSGVPIGVRQSALDTVLHLTRSDDLSDYAPRLMQTWQRGISVPPLQPQLLELLVEIVNQMWKHFEVFRRSVDANLRKYNLNSGEAYEKYIKTAQQAMLHPAERPGKRRGTGAVPPERINAPHSFTPSAAKNMDQILSWTVNKQRLNIDAVVRAWAVDSLVSKEEWAQWLVKLRVAFIKSGSSAAIRAAASLSDQHQHLAKDLFNAAFMSVWTELTEELQDRLTGSLLTALETSNHPDVIQTILNLAEFMDHSERGPLPIAYDRLGKSAEETKAYAKALRYKELQIHKHLNRGGGGLTTEDCQALITYANKLNVQEEAAGVVRYAEQHEMVIPMLGRWYEKLNEWEKALEAYMTDPEPLSDEMVGHQMRCLEALGRWGELNERARTVEKKDQKVAVMAARGAWAVGEWQAMEDYVSQINENSQDGAMLRAVLAVKRDQYDVALNYIDKVRDMYDSELTAMASESYERAYGAMVCVQQLAELEEAMEFKLRPERQTRIALLWSRRLQGCRQNIEQWQRLLMIRSLVLTPQEMHPLRVKFSSLCRKQGKHVMCRDVLRELLGLEPGAPLHKAVAPSEKPQLVLALCKQLWMDDYRNEAVRTLEALVNHLDRLPPNHTPEAARLCAKACLKLGEWTEILAESAPITNGSASLPSPHRSMFDGPPMTDEPTATEQVIRHYARSTEYDKDWHKAWHKLASAYFSALSREKELSQAVAAAAVRSPHTRLIHPAPPPLIPQPAMGLMPPVGAPVQPAPMPPQPMPPQPMMPVTVNTTGVPLMPVGPPPPPGAPPGPMMQLIPPQLSPMPMHNTPMATPPPPAVPVNIAYAVSAVKCFTRALQLAPGSRLEDTLRLLQLMFDYGEYNEVYKQLSENIKGLPIETWLEAVPQLMARLDSRDKMASLVKQVILEISKMKPQALVYALTVAAKSSNVDRQKNAQEMLGVMAEMHPKLVEEASMVSEELVRCAILWHEQWHDALDEASRQYFQEKNTVAMMETLEPVHKMIEKGPTTLKEQSFNQTYYCELSDAYKFCQAFKRTENVKELTQAWEIYCQVFKKITAQLRQLTSLDLNYISPMLMRAKDLELAVPGTYDPSQPVVGIASIGTHLQVISSKQRPRKMTIRGSNGREYAFLLKGHEDPRQDERVMQLFGLINTLLVNNAETCRRNLTIQRYSIVALSHNSGLIGWVPDCDTLHSLVRDYRDKKKVSLSLEHKVMQSLAQDTEQVTLMQKVQLFERALASTTGDDLQHILWLKSPSSEVWFDRRTNYTRSMACMSMVGYILGLGDRHPSNLMLDRLTGKIVHIDFGDCFDVAMTREKFPEKIPFRLTRMLVKAMEVTGIEGNYRFTCERVLRLLRANRESLLAVLEAFVYDPVISWRLLEGTKRVPGEKHDVTRRKTLQEAPRIVRERVIDRIKHKLAGSEFGNGEVDVQEQIDRLVEQATLHENLCQCYIGWCPFW
ncbi:rapamycin binding domain protein [Ancylostoma ceylanicum]|uniref:Serine/threonine-protein kinase TOR n=1 Tax=Ancylostoma ceylanicum TaxID=53326 RepID=A0A0D6M706_9BILA|nr:rapamycin binding domain protein [Ancylostoma ceylanicum]